MVLCIYKKKLFHSNRNVMWFQIIVSSVVVYVVLNQNPMATCLRLFENGDFSFFLWLAFCNNILFQPSKITYFKIFYIQNLRIALFMCHSVFRCRYTVSPHYSRTFIYKFAYSHFKIGRKLQFESQKRTFYLQIQDPQSKMMERMYCE